MSLAVIQWNKLLFELAILRWSIVCSLLIDCASLILFKYSVNTHPLGNTYLLIQFTLLFWIYAIQFKNRPPLKLAYIAFIIFYIINLFFFQGFVFFNTNSNALASLILIFLALQYFYRLMYELPSVHIHRLPMLWISFAVLTYYSGTLFIFLASNYFFQSTEESAVMMWILHNLLNITKNILFAIGLWHSYHKVKSSTLSSSAP
jgi:hypothetical protein